VSYLLLVFFSFDSSFILCVSSCVSYCGYDFRLGTTTIWRGTQMTMMASSCWLWLLEKFGIQMSESKTGKHFTQ